LSKSLRCAAFFAALTATALGAPGARADDRATAQELFADGKALMSAGKVAEACAKFAAAAELTQTAGVRLNLGACYSKLGRTASAWAAYDDALTAADRNGDSVAAGLARDGEAALTPHLSFLTTNVAPETAALADLEVLRDGQRIPKAAWGVPVPVDPGSHAIAARAPGHVAWSGTITVTGEGKKAETMVPVLAAEVVAAPASSSATAPIETKAAGANGLFSGPGGTQRVLAVTSAGAGVVALGVGAIFGLEMLSKKQSDAGGGTCTGGASCGTLSQQAVSAGNVATVCFIAGAVLAGTGAALWFTAPSSTSTGAALQPIAGPHTGGIALGGRF